MPDYEHLAIEDVPNVIAPSDEKREIDEAVGAAAMGVNVYVARPGQSIPFGMHSHPDQEELFYVIAGELVFETPDEDYRVGADELFFVRPDSPHRARAAGDEPARVLAIGAPGEADAATIAELCPHCGETTDRDFAIDDAGPERELVVSCASCGAETDRYTRGPAAE
jgi:quercetin dioxygenase-like cupin family protein